MTGPTFSDDFPTTPNAADKTGNGGGDSFVSKLNADGSALAYSTYLGGTSFDAGIDITLDRAGSAYIVGDTQSADFPTPPAPSTRPLVSLTHS